MMIVMKEYGKNEIPMDLLLLADPDAEHISRYLDSAIFFAAKEKGTVVGEAGVRELPENALEIVTLAVDPVWQGTGIGKNLLEKTISYAKAHGVACLIIKTANSSVGQLALYQKLGFRLHSIHKDYFPQNYSGPIFENGIECLDQIELRYTIYSEHDLQHIVAEYWDSFTSRNPGYIGRKYETWSFGWGEYQANSLLALVKQGKKRGTASALEMYEEGEKVPETGDISIVTYGNGLPGCIIETIDVQVKPFDEITDQEAEIEGEGDSSLEYWRAAHEKAFSREYSESGRAFHPKIPVVFEEFRVIYNENIHHPAAT